MWHVSGFGSRVSSWLETGSVRLAWEPVLSICPSISDGI